jgi:hypothetical protein
MPKPPYIHIADIKAAHSSHFIVQGLEIQGTHKRGQRATQRNSPFDIHINTPIRDKPPVVLTHFVQNHGVPHILGYQREKNL